MKLSTHNKLPMGSCGARISVSEVTIFHIYEIIFLTVGNPGIHLCCEFVSSDAVTVILVMHVEEVKS